MKDKPNWVIVRTRENADTGRLDKFLISPVTGKFAESDNPETWADFDAACKYARENGGVALAYALDGKDGIACIDLDHCVGADGKRSPMRWTGRTALPVSTLTIAWARTASVRHLQTKYCPNAARRISKVR